MTDSSSEFTLEDLADPFTFIAQNNNNPYPAYKFMRDTAPLLDPGALTGAQAADGAGSLLYATGYDVITEITSNPTSVTRTKAIYDTYKEPDDFIGSYADSALVQMSGERHMAFRKILNESFKPRRIRKLRGELTEDVDKYLDAVADRGEMDVVSELAHPFTLTAIMRLVGFPLDEHEWANDVSGRLSAQLDPVARNLPEVRAATNAAMKELVERVDALIVERRANPQDDLISDLVQVMDEGGALTARDIHGAVKAVMGAGHVTTTGQIGNNLLALLQFPDQLQLLRDDPSLAPNGVEELFRFDPVLQMSWRGVTEPWNVAGHDIGESDIMFLFDAAGNRDPVAFPDPDKLDLTRKGNANLTSGGGPHYCLGATLSRMEAEVSLMQMLSRFSSIELKTPAAELPRGGVVSMRGVTQLPISFDLA